MEIEIKKKEYAEIIAESIFPLFKGFAMMYLYHKGKISEDEMLKYCNNAVCELNQKPRDKKIPLKYDKILTN